jgi:hypothetical protein
MRGSILQLIHCDSGHDIRCCGAVTIDREAVGGIAEGGRPRLGADGRKERNERDEGQQ